MAPPVFAGSPAPPPPPDDAARARGRAVRQARLMRARSLRQRLIAGGLALFVAAWLAITLALITGHDPALAKRVASTASAASGTTTASGSTPATTAASTPATTTTTSAPTTTTTTSAPATASSSGSSSAASASSGTGSVVTRQS
jgi:hypothetical protein